MANYGILGKNFLWISHQSLQKYKSQVLSFLQVYLSFDHVAAFPGATWHQLKKRIGIENYLGIASLLFLFSFASRGF